jgi:hypothetical protein
MTLNLILGVFALAAFVAAGFLSASKVEKLLAAGLALLTLMHVLGSFAVRA